MRQNDCLPLNASLLLALEGRQIALQAWGDTIYYGKHTNNKCWNNPRWRRHRV